MFTTFTLMRLFSKKDSSCRLLKVRNILWPYIYYNLILKTFYTSKNSIKSLLLIDNLKQLVKY